MLIQFTLGSQELFLGAAVFLLEEGDDLVLVLGLLLPSRELFRRGRL